MRAFFLPDVPQADVPQAAPRQPAISKPDSRRSSSGPTGIGADRPDRLAQAAIRGPRPPVRLAVARAMFRGNNYV